MSTRTPGIVILTHGELGRELIASVEMIVGPTERVAAIPLVQGQSPESYMVEVQHAIDLHGRGTILLVDLFGGTPSNCAAALSSRYSVEIVSGVNLPMLIEALQIRSSARGETLRRLLVEAGRSGVHDVVGEIDRSRV